MKNMKYFRSKFYKPNGINNNKILIVKTSDVYVTLYYKLSETVNVNGDLYKCITIL